MTNSGSQNIPSLEALDAYTEAFIDTLSQSDEATVVALSGDLGAGKTAFVQSIAKHLGVTEPITSPTFTIMKRYETNSEQFPTLFHMDAYRLESEEEVAPLRLDSIFQTKGALFCIEWAERIKNSLPDNAVFLSLTVDVAGMHTIQRERKQ